MKQHGLTPRQWEVALHVAECEPVKDIAAKLHISVFTVHSHIDSIVHTWALNPTREAQSQIVRRVIELTTATAA